MYVDNNLKFNLKFFKYNELISYFNDIYIYIFYKLYTICSFRNNKNM
jgi:hypothetical protein